jgi:hypothetical protein
MIAEFSDIFVQEIPFEEYEQVIKFPAFSKRK